MVRKVSSSRTSPKDDDADGTKETCIHLLHSLQADLGRDELDRWSQTFHNSRATCLAILCCIVYGATAVAIPLTLKNSVESSPHWISCNLDAACLYFKSIAEGSLPSSLGFNHFIVVNGEEPHYMPTQWQTLRGIQPDLLNQSKVSPICPRIAQDEMEKICFAISRGDTYILGNSTHTAEIGNTLQHLSSGRLFFISALLWGIARILHDCLLLWGANEDLTLRLNLFVLACLACMASSGFTWVASAAELFYAPVDTDCGCYFKMGGVPLTGLLLAPVLVLSHFWNHCSDSVRALLWGDFLMCVKQHVSLRNIRQFANPLSSLIGPTLRSTYANKFDSEEHWAGRSLPSRRTAQLGLIVVSLCIPGVLFPWFYAGSGIMFPRMWQLAGQLSEDLFSRYSIPGLPQAHWSSDTTNLKLGGGAWVYWSLLRMFQASVIVFVSALLPVDLLAWFYWNATRLCRSNRHNSLGLLTIKTPVIRRRSGSHHEVHFKEEKLKQALELLDEALKDTELERWRMDCRESCRLALLDVQASRSKSQSTEDISPAFNVWKTSNRWCVAMVEKGWLWLLRFASLFSKMPALLVITRDLYNMPRLEEHVVLAYKICPEFHIHHTSFFHRQESNRARGGEHASLLGNKMYEPLLVCEREKV